jgi:hypothetical protein
MILMNRGRTLIVVGLALSLAGSLHAQPPSHADMHHDVQHEHQGSATSPTFAELEATAAQLQQARHATEKYRDVQQAEADGYRAIGPDVAGMGIHFVRQGHGDGGFSVERPAILLYEKDPASPGGYALVGVSYLFAAEADRDEQPKNPPFPKSLATWHRHSNLCVFANGSVKGELTASQCQAEGGQFTGLTQWMVHAWIWKDSPLGVFSPTNPTVR